MAHLEPLVLYYHYRCANPNSVNNTSSNGVDIFKIINIVENFLRSENYFNELKNEFNYFKLTQIFMYMMSSNSEDYFQLAKKEIDNLSTDDISGVPQHILKKCDYVQDSDSFEEYKLRKEIDYKKSEIKKLSKQNKSLKKEKKKVDKINKEILSSTSWKVTKPLRTFKRFLKK